MFDILIKALPIHRIVQKMQFLMKNRFHVVSESELLERDNDIAQGVCVRNARGNVSLQRGLVVYSEELERRREKNAAYEFIH